ncbi:MULTISPECIES: hypothetical protein [unclassified Methanoculleus]|uniref:hypothetical protein n=1 Tax=unclassified Methanoculleus TaxID=2619537 RepID=UPI0025D21BF6|nr:MULTISPECIES: hypothetical protein [unclassified Methanoculleus]MCK9317286.1 hypothetical protein [Methanoculleus sp.]MDD3932788.1 hypothetical protein [Methanoculleus sp.]
MTSTEASTVEQMTLDTVTLRRRSERPVVQEVPLARARPTVTPNGKPEEAIR